MKPKSHGVVILGGTGFGAGELLRLLVHHPEVSVAGVISSSKAGEKISSVHPHLLGFYDGVLVHSIEAIDLSAYEKLCFVSALPHGASGEAIASLQGHVSTVNAWFIDLSGDLRLKNHHLHAQYYGANETTEALRVSAQYGLPELYTDKKISSRVISNPGCLATATILSLYPLAHRGLLQTASVVAATGSSGAGRALVDTVHHAVRASNFSSYKVLTHQHEPEILQALSIPSISFVPQRAPIARGIFVTSCVQLEQAQDIRALFQEYYAHSPFIRIRQESPELQNVVGSNFCDISITQHGASVVVLAAIDNLIKGMCGTAIQNMNLAFGFPETRGLFFPSVRPI